MVKLFGQTGKNNFSQNGQIGKKIFCGLNGKRALESRHIGNSELWNQGRVDINAKSIKSKENYLCIVHYTWYAYDCSKDPSKDRLFIVHL